MKTKWKDICAACSEGTPPKQCAYYGDPNGCNAPTLGKHPEGDLAERLQEALEKAEKKIKRTRDALRQISKELWFAIDPQCHDECCTFKRGIARMADDALAETEGGEE